jgi:hypothetical protein
LSTRFCAAPRPDFANGKSRSRTPGSLTVPISRDQIGPIGQSSPPDRGSSRCGDPLVMIRVSVRQPCSIRTTPNGGLLPVVDAAIWRQSAERLQIHDWVRNGYTFPTTARWSTPPETTRQCKEWASRNQ